MKNIILAFLTILIVLAFSCNSKDSKVKSEMKGKENPVKSNENIIDQKSVILYMPDSAEIVKLEKERSEEELNAIEYDKTMAIDFLEGKNIKYYVETRKEYLFKLSSGKIETIDKTSFQNWGAIFFTPNKSPKVVFLNEIESEFDSYFE